MTLLVDTSVWSLALRRDVEVTEPEVLQLKDALRRQGGVQVGTIDALLAQLCVRHDLTLLTTDKDFTHAAAHCPLRVWRAKPRTKR